MVPQNYSPITVDHQYFQSDHIEYFSPETITCFILCITESTCTNIFNKLSSLRLWFANNSLPYTNRISVHIPQIPSIGNPYTATYGRKCNKNQANRKHCISTHVPLYRLSIPNNRENHKRLT